MIVAGVGGNEPHGRESFSRQLSRGLYEHCFVWPEKPHTMNAWNLMHHQVRAQHRAHWREAFRLMALGGQKLDDCHVTVEHIVSTRRKVDVAACMPSVKAALDGCVLAGIIDDDDPVHVRSMKFLAPQYVKGEDALVLWLIGPPSEAALVGPVGDAGTGGDAQPSLLSLPQTSVRPAENVDTKGRL